MMPLRNLAMSGRLLTIQPRKMKTLKRITVAAAAALVLAGVAARAEMEKATPESQGVESRAILNWIDACEKKFDGEKEGRVHGFVIIRHGKTIAEGSWKPFKTFFPLMPLRKIRIHDFIIDVCDLLRGERMNLSPGKARCNRLKLF